MAEAFSKVRAAREAMKEKALATYELYLETIQEARENGEFEFALEHLRWLLEHAPNEDGVRIIDATAAKPKEVDGPRGPTIQIGIALQPSKALPQVIDITHDTDAIVLPEPVRSSQDLQN